jgi:hypothetical protein
MDGDSMKRDDKVNGDVINEDGDVLYCRDDQPMIIKQGFVTMTKSQAKKAADYGWALVGPILTKPEFVTVQRPVMRTVVMMLRPDGQVG